MRLSRFPLTENELMYAARRMAGENQQTVAERFDFHQTAISKMESGEIPVNPKVLKTLPQAGEVPEYIYLSILRRRYRMKLIDAATAAEIPSHRLTDIERGRVDPPEEYVSWLHNVAK